MSAKKPATPKHKYQFLVQRRQMYQFEMQAKTPEDACRILKSKLQHDFPESDGRGGKLVFTYWADPNERDEEWLVMRTTPDRNCESLLLQK